jgi:ribosome-associated toxin RatA of RatAB toxin-antitoxin module
MRVIAGTWLGPAALLGAMLAGANAHAQAVATAPASGATPAPSTTATPTAPSAPGTSVDALRAQDIVVRHVASEGTGLQTGYAATIVHRPLAQVLAAIHDVNHYRDFVPQIVQSQELRRSPNSQDLFVRLAVTPVAYIWARIRYRDAALPNGAVEIQGHSLQGNVDRMDLRWRVTPIDGGAATVLEFWSLVIPVLPIPLPAALLDREQQNAARRGVLAVRRRVEGDASPLLVGRRE